MAELDRQRGERIRELREAHAWTQRQLADRIGVDPKTVHNWEAGKEINPSNLRELADLTKVTPDYIRYGEREAPDLTGMLTASPSQLDQIEAAIAELRAEVATARDEVAALEVSLTKQMRSLARKLGTSGRDSQSQTGG